MAITVNGASVPSVPGATTSRTAGQPSRRCRQHNPFSPVPPHIAFLHAWQTLGPSQAGCDRIMPRIFTARHAPRRQAGLGLIGAGVDAASATMDWVQSVASSAQAADGANRHRSSARPPFTVAGIQRARTLTFVLSAGCGKPSTDQAPPRRALHSHRTGASSPAWMELNLRPRVQQWLSPNRGPIRMQQMHPPAEPTRRIANYKASARGMGSRRCRRRGGRASGAAGEATRPTLRRRMPSHGACGVAGHPLDANTPQSGALRGIGRKHGAPAADQRRLTHGDQAQPGLWRRLGGST